MADDPTPTRWTVEPDTFGLPLLIVEGTATEIDRADHLPWVNEDQWQALLQCVRDADRLRQARELATRLSISCDPSEWKLLIEALLDLLVGGTDG
jgi:hypothetical protein